MPEWTVLEWLGVVGVLAGVLGSYFAWRALRGPAGGSRTRVTIKNSPKARGTGRDMGRGRSSKPDQPHTANVTIEHSEGAEGAGRDKR
ncbi:MAG: hypothetical protein AAFX62_15700 [Pseudomonadota bacterium]